MRPVCVCLAIEHHHHMSPTDIFCKTIALAVINKSGKSGALQFGTMFGLIYHVPFRRILWNGTFQALIQPCFGESVISEILRLWRLSFFWKCSKFKPHFKNEEKNREKVFCFGDNCIWIRCVKLSLSRREYLPSALSLLGNSFEILYITKRGFL